MTARHHIRLGARAGRGGLPISATPAPTVGETLYVARDRKGVDLQRAERDTKIRARHLAALEDDDFAALPGTVYVRGFLRNYAIYLGLDPDEIVAKWQGEQSTAQRAPRESIVAPPRPIAEPKGHLRFTRTILALAVLTCLVLAFAGYVGVQLFRYTQVPAVVLAGGPIRQLPADTTIVRFRGSTTPGVTITVDQAGQTVQTSQASSDGSWTVEVPVTRGRNDFSISATDPTNGKTSQPVSAIVTVAVPGSTTAPANAGDLSPGSTPSASAAAVPSVPATLAVEAPLDGAHLTSAALIVRGTTSAAGVTVVATRGARAAAGPGASPLPSPGSTGFQAGPVAGKPLVHVPADPAPLHVAASGGAYSASLSLFPGHWLITVTTDPSGALPPTVRTAAVDVPAKAGVVLTVRARGGPAWIRVVVDGVVVEKGRQFRSGQLATFVGRQSVVVRTKNAGLTMFTLDGRPLRALGPAGSDQTWHFVRGKAPHR